MKIDRYKLTPEDKERGYIEYRTWNKVTGEPFGGGWNRLILASFHIDDGYLKFNGDYGWEVRHQKKRSTVKVCSAG